MSSLQNSLSGSKLSSLLALCPSLNELQALERKLSKELQRRRDINKLASYQPYRKQRDFHAAGATHRERLFMAGNQLGKTWAGAFEVAMHLTGRYPDWWEGKRFDRPIRMWCAGKDRMQHRDAAQTVLVGPPEDEAQWGTGAIPQECIVDHNRAMGTPNCLDSLVVKHVAGGTSMLGFKTYDMKRTAWQGPTLDMVWFDEEPPLDVYTEGLTRTNKTLGPVMITFTPLLGMSDVVMTFIKESVDLPAALRSGD